MNGSKYFWPPLARPSQIKKLVLLFAEPAGNWRKYDAVIMKTTRTYEKAEKKLKKAMFTSELSSDCSVLSEHIAGPSTSTPCFKFPCPPLEEISSQDASKNAAAKIAASMEGN
ncbi:hypothetical protein AVEN_155573-1 [Araneus ventricosus]|uniref:Uncharacterized protein n=1 Tax=Araneus ventricosus TaxID=182803 RepID=A0A4Y2WMU3_ARAVE|nr:hypothetical protein AVEN_155573-1 [Araneus ventricosus]